MSNNLCTLIPKWREVRCACASRPDGDGTRTKSITQAKLYPLCLIDFTWGGDTKSSAWRQVNHNHISARCAFMHLCGLAVPRMTNDRPGRGNHVPPPLTNPSLSLSCIGPPAAISRSLHASYSVYESTVRVVVNCRSIEPLVIHFSACNVCTSPRSVGVTNHPVRDSFIHSDGMSKPIKQAKPPTRRKSDSTDTRHS